jgi:hypothetical protein
MDFYANPAVLGGIMTWVAMAGWTLGRWHGEGRAAQPVPLAEQPVPQPPFARRESAPAARLTTGPSLSELHEEMTAYRREQQVLRSLGTDLLPLTVLQAKPHSAACSTDPVIAPTRAAKASVDAACGCPACALSAAAELLPLLVPQPSPASARFTRV